MKHQQQLTAPSPTESSSAAARSEVSGGSGFAEDVLKVDEAKLDDPTAAANPSPGHGGGSGSSNNGSFGSVSSIPSSSGDDPRGGGSSGGTCSSGGHRSSASASTGGGGARAAAGGGSLHRFEVLEKQLSAPPPASGGGCSGTVQSGSGLSPSATAVAAGGGVGGGGVGLPPAVSSDLMRITKRMARDDDLVARMTQIVQEECPTGFDRYRLQPHTEAEEGAVGEGNCESGQPTTTTGATPDATDHPPPPPPPRSDTSSSYDMVSSHYSTGGTPQQGQQVQQHPARTAGGAASSTLANSVSVGGSSPPPLHNHQLQHHRPHPHPQQRRTYSASSNASTASTRSTSIRGAQGQHHFASYSSSTLDSYDAQMEREEFERIFSMDFTRLPMPESNNPPWGVGGGGSDPGSPPNYHHHHHHHAQHHFHSPSVSKTSLFKTSTAVQANLSSSSSAAGPSSAAAVLEYDPVVGAGCYPPPEHPHYHQQQQCLEEEYEARFVVGVTPPEAMAVLRGGSASLDSICGLESAAELDADRLEADGFVSDGGEDASSTCTGSATPNLSTHHHHHHNASSQQRQQQPTTGSGVVVPSLELQQLNASSSISSTSAETPLGMAKQSNKVSRSSSSSASKMMSRISTAVGAPRFRKDVSTAAVVLASVACHTATVVSHAVKSIWQTCCSTFNLHVDVAAPEQLFLTDGGSGQEQGQRPSSSPGGGASQSQAGGEAEVATARSLPNTTTTTKSTTTGGSSGGGSGSADLHLAPRRKGNDHLNDQRFYLAAAMLINTSILWALYHRVRPSAVLEPVVDLIQRAFFTAIY